MRTSELCDKSRVAASLSFLSHPSDKPLPQDRHEGGVMKRQRAAAGEGGDRNSLRAKRQGGSEVWGTFLF